MAFKIQPVDSHFLLIFCRYFALHSQDNQSAGLVQRSLKAIFHKIAESHVENFENVDPKDASSGEGDVGRGNVHTTTKASFFEIYNERVYDLLSSNGDSLDEPLPVREDATRGVYVEGLTETHVKDTSEAMDVLRRGMDNRRVAATNMNRVSSRSHAVFVLAVKSERTTHDGISKVRMSKFTLVDLADSERQKSTDAAGDRLKEASMINNSLLCLGQVINSLVDREKGKERHVPFRDSKLTFLLRDSWGGNSKTCLVATVTPSVTSLTETVSTLKFAQRAKLIKNTAVLNENTCGSIAALQAEIARLKNELKLKSDDGGSQQDHYPSLTSPGLPPLAPRLQPSKLINTPVINDITVLALRNQNSKLSQKMMTLEDIADQREIQINSLKRKLQQETMIRKCKERRITYLSSKNQSGSSCTTTTEEDNEELSILREEVLLLRQQLECPPADSIEWMLKYKEEKAKLDNIMQNEEIDSSSLFTPNEREEMETSLIRLMDEKDSLQQKLESQSNEYQSKMDSILKERSKLEDEKLELQSVLDQRSLELLQSEEKIREKEIHCMNMNEKLRTAIECLESAQVELDTEKRKSEGLQTVVDGMKKDVEEMNVDLECNNSRENVA